MGLDIRIIRAKLIYANSNWELVKTRVDDLKYRQYHVREMEELFE